MTAATSAIRCVSSVSWASREVSSARIVGVMAKLLAEQGSGRGLISVCTAGGMGVTAIMEAA